MLLKFVNDYVLFDLETTGLSPARDEVVEISALKVAGGVVREEFSTLVNPGIHIPEMVSRVHGITDDMVADAPCMEKALREFLSFAGDSILVGHNIQRFDLPFIQNAAARYLGTNIGNEYIDTLALARRYLPNLGRYSLDILSDYYGISYVGAHRALVDCRINQQVYEHLAKEPANPSLSEFQLPICPKCGNLLRRRKGIYGEFMGCSSYPDCKYTKKI